VPEPIPVADVKAIAQKCKKRLVVVLAYDEADDQIYTATYGADPVAKAVAATWGDTATKAVGGAVELRRSFEDFRTVPAAERAAENERLHDALKALRDGIDTEELHCEPVPVGSSWRYVIDKALEKKP
jgi:hypothetical protein